MRRRAREPPDRRTSRRSQDVRRDGWRSGRRRDAPATVRDRRRSSSSPRSGGALRGRRGIRRLPDRARTTRRRPRPPTHRRSGHSAPILERGRRGGAHPVGDPACASVRAASHRALRARCRRQYGRTEPQAESRSARGRPARPPRHHPAGLAAAGRAGLPRVRGADRTAARLPARRQRPEPSTRVSPTTSIHLPKEEHR